MTCRDVQMALGNLEQSAENEPTVVMSLALDNAIARHCDDCPSCRKIFEEFEDKFCDVLQYSND